MSRPKSVPDFTALMDASAPIFEKRIHSWRATSPERRAEHSRKRQSLSLATGLIMKSDYPKTSGPVGSPPKQSLNGSREEAKKSQDETDILFYAYAMTSDYTKSPPYLLTFASAAICMQWWALVERQYPEVARPSPQFFIMRSQDMDQIQDDPNFFHLQHKWFCTVQDSHHAPSIIPIQNANGLPVASPEPSPPPPQAEEKTSPSAIDRLTENLTKLASIAETNAAQINALSVAQSAGLQAMQEINESNRTQINAIADSQIKLQALVDQNASHYIALSNSTFQSQEQIRDIMKTTATQIQSLSKNQARFANTCDSMMRAIDSLTTSVEQMNLNAAMSDTASTQSIQSCASLNAMAGRISSGPKKLNRRVKAVWYEYDAMAPTLTPTGSPRKSVNFLDTPPRTPSIMKKT